MSTTEQRRRWNRTQRDNRKAWKRRWRAQHPNLSRARDRASWHRRKHRGNDHRRELRFRWAFRAQHPRGWPLAVVSHAEHARPLFLLVDAAGVLQEEKWETPEELIRRLEKKGALMPPRNPEKPRQLDVETAREILAAHPLSHAEDRTDHEDKLHQWVQRAIMGYPGQSGRQLAIATELAELHARSTALVAELAAIADAAIAEDETKPH